MNIIIADPSGFCFGVKRAIELTEKNLTLRGSLQSLGKIIHNEDEIKRLQSIGLETIPTTDEAKDCVLIRSHGESKETFKRLKEKGVEIVDATCPFVSKLQKLIEKYSKERRIFLFGNSVHPEVEGAIGWSESTVTVFKDLEELKEMSIEDAPSLLVSQTTMRVDSFNEVTTYLETKISDLLTVNTICHATMDRQAAAQELAKKVDCMLIIGGKNSSNTKKLKELCKLYNKNTLLFENSSEIQVQELRKYDTIGISAGASTPQWIIDDVVKKLQMER
ncbi:4-hydroxy-3-methylbut-2-enyl diphosphate reductase [Guggenheimella bovis]